MLAIELDLLTRYIASKFHSFIISLFLKVLGVQKVLVTNIYQLSQFYSQSFSRGRSGAYFVLVFKGNMRMVAIIGFKRGMACTGIFGVIVSKLRY